VRQRVLRRSPSRRVDAGASAGELATTHGPTVTAATISGERAGVRVCVCVCVCTALDSTKPAFCR
jgi:hypothetical protein